MQKTLKIKVFDGKDPQSQYDNGIPDKQTLYILSNGKIYYGEILMIGEEYSDEDIQKLILETLEELTDD